MRPNYQGKSFQCPCSTCMPCFLTGPIIHVQYVCSPLFPPNHPAAQCFVYLGCVVCEAPASFPSFSFSNLGCSWFVLHYSPSSGCKSNTSPPPKLLLLVIKVGAWWGWTPSRLSKECRLNVLLLYLQQPPPAAHHAPTHWSGCWCNFPLFFVCHLSPALSFLALLVCQPAIKACLCLPLPFLLSVTSSLFFISSVVLSDQ